MSFTARVANDSRDILAELGDEITLISPSVFSVKIKAVSRDIAQVIDPNFAVSITDRNINARISIADLAEQNYPFVLPNGEYSLNGHKVEMLYPNGETRKWEIVDFHADKFTGTINLDLNVKGQRQYTHGRFAQ